MKKRGTVVPRKRRGKREKKRKISNVGKSKTPHGPTYIALSTKEGVAKKKTS